MNALLDTGEEMRALARATAERYTWDSYAQNLLKDYLSDLDGAFVKYG